MRKQNKAVKGVEERRITLQAGALKGTRGKSVKRKEAQGEAGRSYSQA